MFVLRTDRRLTGIWLGTKDWLGIDERRWAKRPPTYSNPQSIDSHHWVLQRDRHTPTGREREKSEFTRSDSCCFCAQPDTCCSLMAKCFVRLQRNVPTTISLLLPLHRTWTSSHKSLQVFVPPQTGESSIFPFYSGHFLSMRFTTTQSQSTPLHLLNVNIFIEGQTVTHGERLWQHLCVDIK